MRPGRKPSFRPYRQRNSSGPYGSYRVYDPGQKKSVSLETEDESEALAKVQSLFGSSEQSTSVSEPPSPFPPASDYPRIPADEILQSWAAETSNPGMATQAPADSRPNPPTSPIASNQKPPETPKTPVNRSLLPQPKSVSSEQAAKLGSALCKVVTRLNLVGIEMAVQAFGRDPCELDDDEIDLLKLGWELWLEEYFVKNKPQPWLLVLAGNLTIGLAMYVRGTKRIIEVEDNQIVS